MDGYTSGLSVNQKLIGGTVLGFVIGVLITTLFFTLQANETPGIAATGNAEPVRDGGEERVVSGATAEDSDSVSAVSRGGDRVSANDQSAGSTVRLASVTVSASSWVAVHESISGEPGNVLGAVRLDQGTSQTAVKLLRPTEPGQLYYVRIYRDNGDGAFNLESDPVLVNAAGVPIGDVFQTAAGE